MVAEQGSPCEPPPSVTVTVHFPYECILILVNILNTGVDLSAAVGHRCRHCQPSSWTAVSWFVASCYFVCGYQRFGEVSPLTSGYPEYAGNTLLQNNFNHQQD